MQLSKKLTAEFPNYKWYMIPADDIRSKESVVAKNAIDGLLRGGAYNAAFEKEKQKIVKSLVALKEWLKS